MTLSGGRSDMRVLITGAGGFIGGHLTRALVAEGHDVVACVRHPKTYRPQGARVTVVRGDFAKDMAWTDWVPRLACVDVVINAIGIIRQHGAQTFDALHTWAPIALFRACEAAGVKRVIQLSALGADQGAVSHYHRSKCAADRFLRESALDWVILKPSIVYGPGAKSMALFNAIAALPLIPLIAAGDQRIQPIYIADVTKAVVELVVAPSSLRTDIEMVGPRPITMKALYDRLRAWLGRGTGRYVSIPYELTLHGARWLGLLGRTPITRETVQMLRNGNTGDVRPFVERFGYTPRGLDRVLMEAPSRQCDRWHAGLYFLAPLLRIAIAFVWLLSGVVSALAFPLEQSYAMLAKTGISGIWQPIIVYGAAVADVLLGLALLCVFQLKRVVLLQVTLIALYTTVITACLPEYWMHPFGAVSKNVPLFVATLMTLVLQGER